jgi:hypothetical protein
MSFFFPLLSVVKIKKYLFVKKNIASKINEISAAALKHVGLSGFFFIVKTDWKW